MVGFLAGGGLDLARWSRVELARRLAAAPEMPRISASTIGRWLQAEAIQPWRHRLSLSESPTHSAA